MSGANMEPSPPLEEAFLAAWNAKFGDHAPEWVFSAQDVDREISIRKARIETLRQELNQELFLLEWLQRRASAENGFDSTSQADNTESVVRVQPCVDTVNNINTAPVKTRERFSSPTPGSTDAQLARKCSPVDLLGQIQPPGPLSPDSHVSSDYYSAQLHLSQGTSRSTSDSPLELEEDGTPVRKRFVHCVSSTDERVAKEVHKKLLERGQQCHRSCIDLNKKIGQSSSPVLPRRSLSDPSLRHYRVQHTTAERTPEQPREELVCDSLALSENRGLLSPIPASKEGSGERELDPEEELKGEGKPSESRKARESGPEDEEEEKSELHEEESGSIAEEIEEERKTDLREETRDSEPETGEEKIELQEEEREVIVEEEKGERNPELKSEVREEDRKSEPREEERVLIAEEETEPEVETKSEEREEGGEPESGKEEEKEFEERERSDTLTSDNAKDSKEVVSQEIEPVVESREFVDEHKTMSVTESNRWSKHSSDDAEEEGSLGNSNFKGYSILSEEREDENDPLTSGLVVSRLHNGGLYGLSELDRDDVELLVNGEVDESCHHSNVKEEEILTPTEIAAREGGRAGPAESTNCGVQEGGRAGPVESTNRGVQEGGRAGPVESTNRGVQEGGRAGPVESTNRGVQEQGDVQKSSGKVRGNVKNLDPPTKRSSAYLEDEDECQTPKNEEEIMPLTLENVNKLLKESQVAEQMDSHDTVVESSLDMQDIQRTLSTIKSTPNMSVRTLLNVQEEEMNKRPLVTSSSEPNLLELELTESMEIDEATISAITLGNDMFGSRSNSVTSLPGLVSSSGDESPTLDLASPTCEGVSLRRASNSRKSANRKRMGNAELDPDWEEMVMGSDFSPTNTLSSLSSPSITSVEAYNLPASPLHHNQESSSPPPPAVSNTTAASPVAKRSSRIFPVRCSTVLVHGEALVIRKLVVAGIVSAERSYLSCLMVMKEFYRKPLVAISTTSQSIMTERDVNTIFYRTEDLFELHTTLQEKLEPQLQNWSVSTCVGAFFMDLCRNLRLYKDYVEMYHRSLECLDRFKAESPNFRKFLEDVHATVSNSHKDVPRVNELLRRPIERLQSYSLVLMDLCQHTPDDHADYRVLKESLNVMSAFIASTHDPQSFTQLSGGYNRELLKEGLVVELSEGIRKVRRLFLFHDVLVSTKQKPIRGGMKFEPKWYLPLNELSFHPPEDNEAHRPVPVTSDMELSVMKNKIAELKAQLGKGRERAVSQPDKEGLFKRNFKEKIYTIKSARSEKIKKKLQEQQVSFWVASPSLPLRLYGRHGGHWVFLLHTEDERESWVSCIKKLQPKAVRSVTLSSYELQDLISRQTINDLRKVEEMLLPTVDDEYLSGILRVRVMSAADLKAKQAGLYCCLEVDEYGKFERKARTLPTNTDTATLNTSWDQDFELEIAGAHMMKVQVCSKSLLKEETYAHGKIRLPIKELRQNKRHKLEVTLYPQGKVQLVIEYYTSLASVGRKPAFLSSGVFGVPIEVVTERERHDIPLIVQTCVDEVERRGMSEVGVYRVAGVLRDVQELRQAFDTDYLKAQMIAFDTDIHAVAGLLKRYFRELPDPLFTEELYTSFVQGLGLSDPEAREQCLITLLHSLPPVNFKTASFLLKHLRRVAANSSENKMTLNNLATLFGPNLLRPSGTNPMEMNAAAVDIVTPVSLVLYFLNCPEEYFDENLFRSPEASSLGSRRDKKRESRKKLNIVDEEDGGSLPRRRSKRESTRNPKSKNNKVGSKESVI